MNEWSSSTYFSLTAPPSQLESSFERVSYNCMLCWPLRLSSFCCWIKIIVTCFGSDTRHRWTLRDNLCEVRDKHDNAHVLCENVLICRHDANQLQFNMHSKCKCGQMWTRKMPGSGFSSPGIGPCGDAAQFVKPWHLEGP